MAEDQVHDDTKSDPRYRFNLALLVVLLVLTIVYFRLHLREWVTGFALLGGTFTLWSLWKLVQALLGEWAGFDPKALTFKLLGHSRAREHLIFALVLLGILFTVTSSIYVEHEVGSGQAKYEVEVLRDGNPYLEPITVTSADRTNGRPFFFAGWRKLEFRVKVPADFRPHSRSVRPWSPVRIAVPSAFEKKQLFVLRLVPGLGLRNRLPGPEDEAEVRYRLQATIAGKIELLDDLRRGVVLIGAAGDDLKRAHQGHDRDAFERFLTRYLTRARVPPERQQPLIVDWQRSPRFFPTEELEEGQRIELRLVEMPAEGTASWIACLDVSMDEVGADRVQSVILEPGGCDQDGS